MNRPRRPKQASAFFSPPGIAYGDLPRVSVALRGSAVSFRTRAVVFGKRGAPRQRRRWTA